MRKLILALVLILTLVSCISLSDGGYPVWIEDDPKVNGYIVFVGYGEGENQKDARDKAYENALGLMGSGLGYDPKELYLRELIAYDRINNLGAKVIDYFEEEDNGVYRSWVRIDALETTYIQARSEEYSALLDREKRIEEKLDEALSEYKANRDTEAINRVLEALLISLEGSVEKEEYTSSALTDKAIGYIDTLKLSVRNKDPESAEALIRVSRAKGWFYPRVEEAHVRSFYKMENSSGQIIESYFDSKTNEDGEFRFYSTNPYMIWNGTVKFSIMLDEDIVEVIVDNGGESYIVRILEALDSKSTSFDYEYSGKLDKAKTLIVLSQIDINGQIIRDDTFIKEFHKFLLEAGSEGWSIAKELTEEDITDLIEKIAALYPNIENYIISSIGIVEFAESYSHTFAKTEGYSLIYSRDKNGDVVLVDTQQSFSMGEGDSQASAQKNALEKQARISAGLLLEVL